MEYPTHIHRRGLTLLEMVASLISATVLMATISSTVLMSARMLETTPSDSDATWDRHAHQSLRHDLRDAIEGEYVPANQSILIRRPDPNVADGELDIQYQFDGPNQRIGRSINSATAQPVITDATSFTLNRIDLGLLTTTEASIRQPRIRSISTYSDDRKNEFYVPVPDAAQASDWLILAVASLSLPLQCDGWATVDNSTHWLSRQRIFIRRHAGDASDAFVELNPGGWFRPNQPVLAVMLAIEDPYDASPVRSAASIKGLVDVSDSATWATIIEPADLADTDLNLQFISGRKDQWQENSFGIPSFTDILRIGVGSGDGEIHLNVLSRIGPSSIPTGMERPVPAEEEASWIATGVALGGEVP